MADRIGIATWTRTFFATRFPTICPPRLGADKDWADALLQEKGRVPFTEVFTPPHNRGRLLGLFLAILELIKARRIHAEQPDLFTDIWLVLAPPAANGETA